MNKTLLYCLSPLLVVALGLQVGCKCMCCADSQTAGEVAWTPLLADGMDDWKPIIFGGEGEVRFENGSLTMDMGGPLTGVKYAGDIEALLGPELEPYEISLQAKRVEGMDFFCGLTFPIGKEGHVSLILGGWAGSMVGLSSLDGMDAASNKTTQMIAFEQDRWYAIRVRVTPEKIGCWLDDKQIIDVNRADYTEFSLRGEVLDTAPLGICTFQTRGDIRDMKVRKLK